jgi:hypothetical protein
MGREKLTVMIIPHTEKRTNSLVISYRSISLFVASVVLLLMISSLNVLRHSGSIHEMTELNLTNNDFARQSQKMREEVGSLHEIITYYYQRITNLYIKLGGDPAIVSKSMGPVADPNLVAMKGDLPPAEIPSEAYLLKEDVHNLNLSSELSQEIIKMIKKRKSIIKHTPSLWPAKGYVLFPYGDYIDPLTGKAEFNKGIDIGTFPGAEVVSAAPGLVYEIGHTSTTGYYLKIAHKFGWKTIYSNLDRIRVKRNERVSKGDVIGYAGKTPDNPVYHVHYEVHVGTQALNPFSFLNQIQE